MGCKLILVIAVVLANIRINITAGLVQTNSAAESVYAANSGSGNSLVTIGSAATVTSANNIGVQLAGMGSGSRIAVINGMVRGDNTDDADVNIAGNGTVVIGSAAVIGIAPEGGSTYNTAIESSGALDLIYLLADSVDIAARVIGTATSFYSCNE